MPTTVAQIILKALATWGVKNIYGLSGDAILPLMDALGRQNVINFYSAATEQGAAFMAGGEARVTGRPGVCLATEGPGALNLVNGVADAYQDGIPMLIITGQVETAKLATNTKQYLNQQQLFTPISGFTTQLTRPESVLEVFKVAMEKAIGDSTTAHISIPKDILMSPIDDLTVPSLGHPKPPNISGNIEDAIDIVKGYDKPIIIVGRVGIPFKDKIYRLAGLMGAGIIPAQGARGIYPGTENNVLAGLGEAHIPPEINEANCILLIGASPYEHKFIPPGIKIIQIDIRPQNLVHRLRPVAITGDLDLILDGLIKGLADFKPNSGWFEQIKKYHDQHLAMIKEEGRILDQPISPRKVISILNNILPENAIVCLDTGEFMHWFDRGFIARQQEIIISDFWRCMGGGLSLGLGAQMADPQRRVIILIGNGGFVMSMQELITATRYGLPVIVLIFNNGVYSLEEHRMEKSGMAPFGTNVANPDFVKIADACGAEGIKVTEPEKLSEALQEAVGLKKTVVIDILVNQERPAFI